MQNNVGLRNPPLCTASYTHPTIWPISRIVVTIGLPVRLTCIEGQKNPKSDPADVDSDILARYIGKYELVPGAVFTVTTKDDKLFVGLTGQPSFEVYPRSETEWFYKVVEATLTFDVNKRGKCNAVELFQNGVRQKAKRIE